MIKMLQKIILLWWNKECRLFWSSWCNRSSGYFPSKLSLWRWWGNFHQIASHFVIIYTSMTRINPIIHNNTSSIPVYTRINIRRWVKTWFWWSCWWSWYNNFSFWLNLNTSINRSPWWWWW